MPESRPLLALLSAMALVTGAIACGDSGSDEHGNGAQAGSGAAAGAAGGGSAQGGSAGNTAGQGGGSNTAGSANAGSSNAGSGGAGGGGEPDPLPAEICSPSISLYDTTTPSAVIGSGTPDSCNEDDLRAAAEQGGIITFDCGTEPVTIAISQTINLPIDKDTIIDGEGKVTL
ncbi:MAG TPA: hypothetical protein VGP93_10215, partial [Polyangiaceae bacterium]|nr:hypothetical protein [Polyangiaceae bacterium]